MNVECKKANLIQAEGRIGSGQGLAETGTGCRNEEQLVDGY